MTPLESKTMSNASTKPFAVVTGGSSGIGLALAKQFAQNGFDLLLAAEPDGTRPGRPGGAGTGRGCADPGRGPRQL